MTCVRGKYKYSRLYIHDIPGYLNTWIGVSCYVKQRPLVGRPIGSLDRIGQHGIFVWIRTFRCLKNVEHNCWKMFSFLDDLMRAEMHGNIIIFKGCIIVNCLIRKKSFSIPNALPSITNQCWWHSTNHLVMYISYLIFSPWFSLNGVRCLKTIGVPNYQYRQTFSFKNEI